MIILSACPHPAPIDGLITYGLVVQLQPSTRSRCRCSSSPAEAVEHPVSDALVKTVNLSEYAIMFDSTNHIHAVRFHVQIDAHLQLSYVVGGPECNAQFLVLNEHAGYVMFAE